jgi:hypothetical protein
MQQLTENGVYFSVNKKKKHLVKLSIAENLLKKGLPGNF